MFLVKTIRRTLEVNHAGKFVEHQQGRHEHGLSSIGQQGGSLLDHTVNRAA